MTVSNVLRGKGTVKKSTAERVTKIAKELNYQPNLAARQLSSGRTNVIGFSTVEIDYSPFSANLAAAVSDLAFARGYQTLIQQTRRSTAYETSMLSAISAQLTDGMILCAPTVPAKTLADMGVSYPLVVFDAPFAPPANVDGVFTPCEESSRAAVNHLFEQGCTRILVLGANRLDPQELAVTDTLDGKRLRGASLAFDDHHAQLENDLVQRCEWSIQDGYRVMAHLLDSQLMFDGLFCLSDVIAIGASRALLDRGRRIPDDVAVIGFDGLVESPFLNPPLSSVTIDPHIVAKECLDLLTDRIAHPKRHVIECRSVPFSLTIRESSRKR